MPAKINKWFNNNGASIGSRRERNLVQGLVDESIQIHGFQLTWIPRVENEKDCAWQEDVTPSWTKSFTIEGFMQSFDGWEGDGVMNTKYGLSLDQMARVWVSRGRWRQEHETNESLVPLRPLVGDIVLMSFGDFDNVQDEKAWNSENLSVNDKNTAKLFEVMYIDVEPDKWQLRGQYYYDVALRLTDYSNDNISLHNADTDEHNYIFGNEQDKLDNLKTEDKSTIYANIDPDTGNEFGNIKDVVVTAQNRELEICANEIAPDQPLQPETDTSDPDKELSCDTNLPEDELPGGGPKPFDLPGGW